MTAPRKIWIASGKGNLGIIRSQTEMTWTEFCAQQHNVAVLPVTKAQYAELTNDAKAALKKSLGFSLAARYRGTARKGVDVVHRDALNIDLDKLAPDVYAAVLAAAKKAGRGFLHVGSASNEVNGKRSGRLIVPLRRSVTPEEFPAASRKFSEALGIENVDPVSHQVNQICYDPARCSDASAVFEECEGPWLDPDALLAQYDNWQDPAQWPRTSRELSVSGSTAPLGDPGEKPGLVGAWCRLYDVVRAIESFELPYSSTVDERRWTPHGASSSGGARVYGHPKDPDACAWMFNSHTNGISPQRNICSYDMVRVHRFGALDKDAASDTPVNKLPSSLAMDKWIRAEHSDVAAEAERVAEQDEIVFKNLCAADREPSAEAPPAASDDDALEAQFKVTDQANAKRLADAFGSGKRLCSVGGVFYAWSKAGTHWVADSTDEVRKCAQQLSKIIRCEASPLRRGAKAAETKWQESLTPEQKVRAADHPRTPKHSLEQGPDYEMFERLDKEAAALETWALSSEMTARQDAALKQLRERLNKDASVLDKDPALLNCLSGTINLRTGDMHTHSPADYITVCAPVRYTPGAKAPKFEQFLSDVFNGDRELVQFLQRWYGYCATGDVSEQKLKIDLGRGSNGKGVILHCVEAVMGAYACPAPATLLADNGKGSDRHPTEIAKLKGKRLVSAQEPDRSAIMRDGLIKWMTGGDKLTARTMRQDFSDFIPTHKLQLLTNYEPVIKSQDNGIRRRVMLLKFPNTYGTPEEVAAGEATHVKNLKLEAELLREESEGIFAWIVAGAKEWYRQGLNAPESVLLATREYLDGQDRIGAFVRERLVPDPESRLSYNHGTSSLFGAYTGWCESRNYSPLMYDNFIKDIKAAAPWAQPYSWKERDSDGTRVSEYGLRGVALTSEEFSDRTAPAISPASKPAPRPASASNGHAADWTDGSAPDAAPGRCWQQMPLQRRELAYPTANAKKRQAAFEHCGISVAIKPGRNGATIFVVNVPVDAVAYADLMAQVAAQFAGAERSTT